MEAPSAKLRGAFCLLLLFCSLVAARQNVPECCRQKTCSCRIYELLHGMGNHAAGILTLGKRKSVPPAFQSRLYRLLHGSGNHAAGILTMGKRGERAACHMAMGCAPGTDVPPTLATSHSIPGPGQCRGQSGAQGTTTSFY